MEEYHSKNIDNIPLKFVGEIFKPLHKIFNTCDYYISNFSRLYSFKTRIYLKLTPKKYGYTQVRLTLNTGKEHTYSLSELVIVTFKGNKPNGAQIDHINRDITNNKLENLRYLTASDNCKNKSLQEIRHKNKPVKMIRLLNDEEVIYPSITIAEKETKIDQRTIRKYCRTNRIYNNLSFSYYFENIENEDWKEIIYNNEKIECSNKGRIKRKNGSVNIGYINGNGYRSITINKKTFLLHRIICETFHGTASGGKNYVNHLDENKLNNYAENLEWCSHIENMRHSNSKIVLQYNLENELIREYRDSLEAEEKTKVCDNNILKCCRGERKTAGGYIWKFKETYDKKYDHGKAVIQLSKDGKMIEKYISISEAIRKTGITHIGDVCMGKRKSAGKFKWIYEEEYEYTEIEFID